jgi:hypothetical protein
MSSGEMSVRGKVRIIVRYNRCRSFQVFILNAHEQIHGIWMLQRAKKMFTHFSIVVGEGWWRLWGFKSDWTRVTRHHIFSLYTYALYRTRVTSRHLEKKKEIKYMFLTGNMHFTPRKMVNSGWEKNKSSHIISGKNDFFPSARRKAGGEKITKTDYRISQKRTQFRIEQFDKLRVFENKTLGKYGFLRSGQDPGGLNAE